MTARKKKGPGRPRLTPDQRSKAVTFSVRMPVEMKARLDAAVTARDRKDWKLNTEVIKRLERSLDRDAIGEVKDAFGGSRTFYFLMMVAEIVSGIERLIQMFAPQKSVEGRWMDDPYIYAKVSEGINEVLGLIAPTGDASPPENMKKMVMPQEQIGQSITWGVINSLILADDVPPTDQQDDDGFSKIFSDQLKRLSLIKKELGPDVVSRIGMK